jgi:Tol biopolymer transport system component
MWFCYYFYEERLPIKKTRYILLIVVAFMVLVIVGYLAVRYQSNKNPPSFATSIQYPFVFSAAPPSEGLMAAPKVYVAKSSDKVVKISGNLQGAINPTFSPDKSQVAFSAFRDGQTSAIFVVKTDGSALHQVSQMNGTKYMPSWSPDGKKLIYALRVPGSGGLVEIDLSASKETKVAGDFVKTDTPQWLTDGSGFSYVGIDIDAQGNITARHLMIYKNNRASEIKLNYNGSQISDMVDPTFSGDGKKIVFTRQSDNAVYTAGSDGSSVAKLTPDGSGSVFSCPSWSADGSTVLTGESLKSSNKEYVTLLSSGSGTSTHWSNGDFFKMNCPRMARY